MKNYKSTYLVRSTNTSEAPLVEVTGKQWFEIVKENKGLPKSRQRYFIVDQITEGSFVDRIVIEVSEQEYKQWKNERQVLRRKVEQTAEEQAER